MKKRVFLFFLLVNFMLPTAYAEKLPENLLLGLQKMESLQGFTCQFEQNIAFADGRVNKSRRTLVGL